MPTYQYACTECGERLEVVQKFSDDPLTVCPSCEGRLRKVFSPVGVVFKGSGFYKTDSRAKSTASSAASSDSASGEKPSGEKPSGEKSTGADKSSPGRTETTQTETTRTPETKPSSTGGSTGSGDGSKVA